MPSNIPQRGLRMEDELYLKLVEIAKRENRSFNQEAVYILKEFTKQYEAKNGEIIINTDTLYE